MIELPLKHFFTKHIVALVHLPFFKDRKMRLGIIKMCVSSGSMV